MQRHTKKRIAYYQDALPGLKSKIAGAALMLACDTIARTAFSPYELPVGILLALGGGPFFLALLLRKEERHD